MSERCPAFQLPRKMPSTCFHLEQKDSLVFLQAHHNLYPSSELFLTYCTYRFCFLSYLLIPLHQTSKEVSLLLKKTFSFNGQWVNQNLTPMYIHLLSQCWCNSHTGKRHGAATWFAEVLNSMPSTKSEKGKVTVIVEKRVWKLPPPQLSRS